MEMVEIVARAISAAEISGQKVSFSDGYAREMARAAIAAMREPPPAIDIAMAKATIEWRRGDYTKTERRAIWQCAIDAALSPTQSK